MSPNASTAASTGAVVDPRAVAIDTASVDAAITSRQSIRAFLPTPVPRATIEAILETASRAPSGSNTQPWRVRVVTGALRDRLCRAVLDVAEDPRAVAEAKQEYQYYPVRWESPFIDRRRACGWGLYGTLGIAKGDKLRMQEQHHRNYVLFDAPVGLFFTIDRTLELGSWLDYGMFIQSVMIAARGHGLDTCPQAAWLPFHATIGRVLDIPATEQLVCGMALGWADWSKPENRFVTEREPVTGFASFHE